MKSRLLLFIFWVISHDIVASYPYYQQYQHGSGYYPASNWPVHQTHQNPTPAYPVQPTMFLPQGATPQHEPNFDLSPVHVPQQEFKPVIEQVEVETQLNSSSQQEISHNSVHAELQGPHFPAFNNYPEVATPLVGPNGYQQPWPAVPPVYYNPESYAPPVQWQPPYQPQVAYPPWQPNVPPPVHSYYVNPYDGHNLYNSPAPVQYQTHVESLAKGNNHQETSSGKSELKDIFPPHKKRYLVMYPNGTTETIHIEHAELMKTDLLNENKNVNEQNLTNAQNNNNYEVSDQPPFNNDIKNTEPSQIHYSNQQYSSLGAVDYYQPTQHNSNYDSVQDATHTWGTKSNDQNKIAELANDSNPTTASPYLTPEVKHQESDTGAVLHQDDLDKDNKKVDNNLYDTIAIETEASLNKTQSSDASLKIRESDEFHISDVVSDSEKYKSVDIATSTEAENTNKKTEDEGIFDKFVKALSPSNDVGDKAFFFDFSKPKHNDKPISWVHPDEQFRPNPNSGNISEYEMMLYDMVMTPFVQKNGTISISEDGITTEEIIETAWRHKDDARPRQIKITKIITYPEDPCNATEKTLVDETVTNETK